MPNPFVRNCTSKLQLTLEVRSGHEKTSHTFYAQSHFLDPAGTVLMTYHQTHSAPIKNYTPPKFHSLESN